MTVAAVIRTVHAHTRGPFATLPASIGEGFERQRSAAALASVLLEGDPVFARALARGKHDLARRILRGAQTAPLVFCERCACCHFGGCPAERNGQ